MSLYSLEYTYEHKIIFVYNRLSYAAPQRGSPSYILGVIRHFLKRNDVQIKHLEQSKTWIKTRLWPSIIVFDISIIHLFRQLQH
jgi:hypothetical protein